MPNIPLPHQVTPFSLTLAEYLQLVEKAADDHGRAPACEIERRGDDEARVTIVDASRARVFELHAIEKGGRARILSARLQVGAVEWARRRLARARHLYGLPIAALSMIVLEVILVASWPKQPAPASVGLSCWFIAVTLLGLYVACRVLQAITPLAAYNAEAEPFLRLLGRVGDIALVRPPSLPAKFANKDARAIDRDLRASARVPIQALHEHESATIVGRVSPASPLQSAPLSGRPCVYWELRVSLLDGSSELGDQWLDLGEIRSVRPFCIVDDSGWAPFDPSRAALSVQCDRVVELSCARSDELFELLQRAKLLEEHHRQRTIRVEEALLLKGQEVVARGTWISEPDHDAAASLGAYRAMPPSRLRFVDVTRPRACLSSDPACISGAS